MNEIQDLYRYQSELNMLRMNNRQYYVYEIITGDWLSHGFLSKIIENNKEL